jgi:hypothetical protein
MSEWSSGSNLRKSAMWVDGLRLRLLLLKAWVPMMMLVLLGAKVVVWRTTVLHLLMLAVRAVVHQRRMHVVLVLQANVCAVVDGLVGGQARHTDELLLLIPPLIIRKRKHITHKHQRLLVGRVVIVVGSAEPSVRCIHEHRVVCESLELVCEELKIHDRLLLHVGQLCVAAAVVHPLRLLVALLHGMPRAHHLLVALCVYCVY